MSTKYIETYERRDLLKVVMTATDSPGWSQDLHYNEQRVVNTHYHQGDNGPKNPDGTSVIHRYFKNDITYEFSPIHTSFAQAFDQIRINGVVEGYGCSVGVMHDLPFKPYGPPTRNEYINAFKRCTPNGDINVLDLLTTGKEMPDTIDPSKLPRIKGADGALKNIGSILLGLNFGVLPTIADASEFIEFYNSTLAGALQLKSKNWNNHFLNGQPITYRAIVRRHMEVIGAEPRVVRTRDISTDYTIQGYREVITVLNVRIRVKNLLSPAQIGAEVLGLNAPLSSLWEMTKFSWLIDYFTNMSEIISSWEKNLGLSAFKYELVDSYITETCTDLCASSSGVTRLYGTRISLPPCVRTSITKSRDFIDETTFRGVEDFEFSKPTVSQLLNIGALVGSTLGK